MRGDAYRVVVVCWRVSAGSVFLHLAFRQGQIQMQGNFTPRPASRTYVWLGTARRNRRRGQRGENGVVKEDETFCHRCQQVVKTTIAGVCVACGVMVAAPATGAALVTGPLTGHSVIYQPPAVSAEGPHIPELPFSVNVPGPEYSGTATTMTFTGTVRASRAAMGGTVNTA